jgi:uncharacterized membrane-anchored protein
MNPRLMLSLFLAVSAIQVWIPIGQIRQHEDVLRTGRAYKFRTAPVDPYDAFRGKYVALNYANTTATIKPGENLSFRSPAYVTLSQGENGFAVFGELSTDPPPSGDYVRVEYLFLSNLGNAQFRLPFDRLFMEEGKAPKAEQAYWRYGNRRGQPVAQAYALVRLKNGRGVIEDLFINDQPVREFIKSRRP